MKIKNLCDLKETECEKVQHIITSPVERKRARHAVLENIRVKKAIAALEKNDIEESGALMNASHISLRDDYEVTGIELDTLVESAWNQSGTIGARMTGAGLEAVRLQLSEMMILRTSQLQCAESIHRQSDMNRISISHPLVTVQGNWRSCEG